MSEPRKACDLIATVKVYWPGRDPTYMCPIHARMAANVARSMSFHLVIEQISIDEMESHNCQCEHFSQVDK